MSISSASESKNKSILLISTDISFKSSIKEQLQQQGYTVLEVNSQGDALAMLDKETIPIVFLDIERMPPIELDIVSYIRTRHNAEVVILTTINELEDATHALRSGAAFYLVKPVNPGDLIAVLEKLSLRIERRTEHIELEHRFLSDLMAGSPVMQKTLRYAVKIAPTSSTVLVGGESGTGKEFFARIIHRMSNRFTGRFVPMNCGAIPEALFESELFGHKKGSFTGADRDKTGIVEEAHLGTLFLDEVGELSPSAQVKLLRFLQGREFRRVGETVNRSVDVRIIAATNKDLTARIKQGLFREDLYFRLNVFYIHLPPLRERRETIPNLVRLFVHRNNQLFGKNVNSISKSAEVLLANYHYPGNIRELENIIEHAVVLAEGEEMGERDLPDFIIRNRLLLPEPSAGAQSTDEIRPLTEVEREYIARALKATGYNYTEASKKLGISRSTLWRKIKDFHIETV
ncbi:MAG: sigma-54-dependent Fis family transcriptional regulator [Chitinispirillaceae bacterium]|nr:sigma-54-dependent Fis family transcriptional regulator [Chitinispirillaceae bacterium]